MVAKGEGVGGGMEWEVGVSRYKLLYIEWITTRSYCIQYPEIFIFFFIMVYCRILNIVQFYIYN